MPVMFKQFEFCLPSAAKAAPDGPDWIHEIKYDGYRLRVERNGRDVRLITKGGHNWTSRFPWIAEAALKNRERQFIIDARPWCSAWMACPISTPCTHAGTMPRCSSTPSTSSRSAARICASYL
ncbi:ATP-dependent DNA ligase [Bradyrhizobium sp. USDA 4448]